MNNCKNCEFRFKEKNRTPCRQCEADGDFGWWEHYDTRFVIDELEKLKAEIKEEEEKGIYFECEDWIEGRPCDEDYFFGLLRAIMIIDKHISDLKGE